MLAESKAFFSAALIYRHRTILPVRARTLRATPPKEAVPISDLSSTRFTLYSVAECCLLTTLKFGRNFLRGK
ncbi:hypothetical protein DPMN_181375 [Dreissena polymorpha]|uniref:Uncharacterized protein n=1 Tax=Dreissena polymorpha TaxID=45954 RepID=A0A9D4DDK6_DREPO|nr:hypothetical protein DPMN_181375 [Dreissena polymorpha]